MYKKIVIILILSLISYNSVFAQFSTSIISPQDTSTCRDTLTFTAQTTINGSIISDVTYTWDFDDGTFISGVNKDTVKHIFKKGGGYIVQVTAEKGTDKDYALRKIQIALTPNFNGTEANKTEAMCLGQEALLTGVVSPVTWEHHPELNTEDQARLIDDNNVYSSDFDYRIFGKTETVTATTDIDTVAVFLEHSNLSNLKIELSCPDGNSITLKDFGGADAAFGNPDNSEGYWYYWTNNPDNGTINSTSPTNGLLPSGSYTPDESFSNLTGCHLNGDWLIKITDNTNLDSGYVYSTILKFNNSILPALWSFTNTYTSSLWIGPGVSSTINGIASAEPETKGNSEYKFFVKDNFTCWQDTSIFLRVTGAGFTAEPTEGPFDLEVKFTNTTDWATDYVWDFGDGSERSSEENPTHTYTYPDGRYKVLFTAIADDGCKDTDTATITVTIPEAVFNEPPNAFSPNGDNSNDFFSLNVENFQYFECWIYSRWGGLVKKLESLEEAQSGWDGKIQGSNREAPPGIYFYYIKAIDYHGQEVYKKGSVQLFR